MAHKHHRVENFKLFFTLQGCDFEPCWLFALPGFWTYASAVTSEDLVLKRFSRVREFLSYKHQLILIHCPFPSASPAEFLFLVFLHSSLGESRGVLFCTSVLQWSKCTSKYFWGYYLPSQLLLSQTPALTITHLLFIIITASIYVLNSVHIPQNKFLIPENSCCILPWS